LSEPAAFIGIKVDVVDEQRSSAKGSWNDSGQTIGQGGVIPSGSEVAVRKFTEFKVDLDFVVLESNQRESTFIPYPFGN
jgi:hypothetical protein